MVHGIGRRRRVVDVHAGHAKPRAELTAHDRGVVWRHGSDQRRGLLRQVMSEEIRPSASLRLSMSA